MTTIDIIVGGQFGSEGKGHICAQLAAHTERPVHIVRVAGPNAGHTAIGKLDQQPWALRQIPVAAVTNLAAQLYIAAGSEIDPAVLHDEITRLDAAGYKITSRLHIDGDATIIEQRHKDTENGLNGRIGSTAKGIGAARADRLMRNADLWYNHGNGEDTAAILRRVINRDEDIIIEGTQGYGLGLTAGHYPFCTSSNTRAIDFLAMAGVSPWQANEVQVRPWVVFRTYPIRVAGNSGTLRNETSWEALSAQTGGHIQPERTTVTQKIRRVGHWDPELYRSACNANGWPNICEALTFADYIDPTIANTTNISDRLLDWIDANMSGMPEAITTGPDTIIWNK